MMISSSLNSDISQRIKFFGLMRCLGATRRQILRYVRREALQWCVTAIPIGTGLSIVVVWGLCAVMRQLSNAWFGYLPVFGISWLGIGAGSVLGLITVLLAARSPAKNGCQSFAIGSSHRQYPAKHLISPWGEYSSVACGDSLGDLSCKSKAKKFLSDDRCVCHLHYAFFRILYSGSLYGKCLYAESMGS